MGMFMYNKCGFWLYYFISEDSWNNICFSFTHN